MRSAAIVLGDSAGIGLTYHGSHLAVALNEAARGGPLRVLLGSTAGEQFPGLWERVRAALGSEDARVLGAEPGALRAEVEALLAQHDRVVVHVGGVRSLREIIPLRSRHAGRVRIVFTVNTFGLGQWRRHPLSLVMAYLLYRHVDYVNFLTPWAAGRFHLSTLLLRRGRAGFLPWGLERADGPQGARNPEADRTFDFVYLAYFHEAKGHLWLVRSMAPVLRSYPQARLVLAGSGTTLERIRKWVVAEKLERSILFLGQVDRARVPSLLDQCRVGIVASRGETFGQTYIEPMARGLPVIGSRVGVGQWVIQDYVTGLGVQFGDDVALREAARFMLENPEAATRMGENARSLVVEHFTWPKVAAAYLRVYREVLNREGR